MYASHITQPCTRGEGKHIGLSGLGSFIEPFTPTWRGAITSRRFAPHPVAIPTKSRPSANLCQRERRKPLPVVTWEPLVITPG